MKPPPFRYHAPSSVEEAVAVLAEVGHDGKVLAGGQSLIPILNMRLASPEHLVDINRVAGLDGVQVTDEGVRVGALVRHSALERHEGAFAANPLLRQGLQSVAHPVIRNRGTTVGSIAHADPSGEMPAVLALTGGHVEAVSSAGTRRIAPEDFFLGPLETSLAEEELVTAVLFGPLPGDPRAGTRAGTAFAEIARRHGDYGLAGVAAVVTVADGAVTAARASFVSLTAVPCALDLTDVLGGSAVDPDGAGPDWAAAAEAVRAFVEPEDDIHADAAYRRLLAGAIAERVLRQAARNAQTARNAQEGHDRAPTTQGGQR